MEFRVSGVGVSGLGLRTGLVWLGVCELICSMLDTVFELAVHVQGGVEDEVLSREGLGVLEDGAADVAFVKQDDERFERHHQHKDSVVELASSHQQHPASKK